jgi:hypothetical protein
MFYLYCRKRSHHDYHFIEFFATFRNGSLCLPDARVGRFQGRSIGPEDVINPVQYGPLMNLSISRPTYLGSETCCFTVIAVDSKSSGIVKRERSEICANGTWLTYHDVVPKGGPIGPSVAVFYGVPIEHNAFRYLYHGMSRIYESCHKIWPVKFTDPFVVYHGTSKANIKSIITSGLKPTHGMLGTAVYFGSFWKAFRFATLSQDYKKRPGAIFRCYAFWASPYYKTLQSGPCTCGCNTVGADHTASWTSFGDAVFLIPEVGSTVKNEEYASLNSEKVLLDGIAYAEAQTEHHEPLNRSLQIL